MGELASWFWEQIKAALRWIGDLFLEVFKAIWDLLTDLVCWVFDKLLDLAVSAVAGLNVSAISGSVSAWGSIPPEVMNILSLLNVGTAIAIITAAITIRLVLQLIPFVRLGS
jgi:hypothetical protein